MPAGRDRASWRVHDARAAGPELRTDRLLLRRWRADDRAPFAALNADPVVMEYFPARAHARRERRASSIASRPRSTSGAGGSGRSRCTDDGRAFAGYVGLWPAVFEADFTPAVEIGWRLAAAYWGHGYAPEAARAALAFGFDTLGARRDRVVHRRCTTCARSASCRRSA